MFARWFFLLLLMFSAPLLASPFKTEIIEYIDDVKVVAFISENDIADSPQWDPMQKEVPLSISKLIDIFKSKVLKQDASGKQPAILEIELKEIPGHKGYWHYLVKTAGTRNEVKHDNFFVVLMNGQVISAIKEPEAIK